MTNTSRKWDIRFVGLARFVAQWSKDPSTKTGAVIVDSKRRVISLGYNGFPRGVEDKATRYLDREMKYKMIVHCERNALAFACRPVEGATLYSWPFMACSTCAGIVIQHGIARCVAPTMPERFKERWGEDMAVATTMFHEAGVVLDLYDLDLLGVENS